MSDQSGKPADEKLGPALLHVCREFRIVGLDVFYSNNNFVFDSDAQLQHLLTTIQPHYIACVQHIALTLTITMHFRRSPFELSKQKFTPQRTSGVFRYAALASLPKLRNILLYISLVLDETFVPLRACSDACGVVTRIIGMDDLPWVLAIETWPFIQACYGEFVAGNKNNVKCLWHRGRCLRPRCQSC
jgi:hypothetical protein